MVGWTVEGSRPPRLHNSKNPAKVDPARTNSRGFSMKKCSRCDTEKPTSEYHKDRRNSTGLYGWCKNCAKEKAREYRANNIDKVRESQKQSKKNKPDFYRNKRLVYEFGITLAEYQEMLKSQNSVCAICFQPERRIHPRTGRLWELCVDHDHATGEIRGLLCCDCNTALGLFRDNPSNIRAAINYLEK